MVNQDQHTKKARLATLDQLIETTVSAYLSPPPRKRTLANWFDEAEIPRFKASPGAKRGGGLCWYSVPHVEKYFRNRTLTGRIQHQEVAR